MRATALCALLILATGLPVIAQDGDGLEGPMGHPDFVARWNHFGGNMGVTGSHGPGTPGYHYVQQTSSAGRAFYRYLGASIPSQRLGPSWWRFKAKNAHHFEIRSPEGEPIVGARFVLSLPRQGKVFALEQKSDHNGAIGIRLLKPRKAHDVFHRVELRLHPDHENSRVSTPVRDGLKAVGGILHAALD